MAKKLINQTHVEGYVYEHKLEKKVSGENSKNPGTEFINGILRIATDDAMLNVVDVHFSYVTETTKNGKSNATYGVLLNIIEGKPLCLNLDKLTDADGNFNNSYVQILLKSLNKKDNLFMEQMEKEFRAQIEEVLRYTKVTHIDSHVHVHSIPPVFELVCKLAKEYRIKHIRTQFEKPYIIPDVNRHLTLKYPINLIKVALLDFFTVINRKKVHEYELKTNDYLIGVAYTSMMNSLSVSYGLLALKNYENITAEALIHPCRYEDGTIDNHFIEFQITKNMKLKDKIEKMGFEISNYNEEN